MSIILPERHIAFTSSNEINQICTPLKDFDIDYFTYIKSFKDNSEATLCNQPYWVKHFYDQGLYRLGSFEGPPDFYRSGYALWSTLNGQEIYSAAKSCFDIDYGITVIKKSGGDCEFFCFGTTLKNPAVINFYLNNLDLLDRFIIYFRDKAAKLIQEASHSKIHVRRIDEGVKKDIEIIYKNINDPQYKDDVKKQFLRKIKIKNYCLNGNKQNIVISNRELECAMHLLEGKSAKEIAEKLFISKRTVEKHLENIKLKLHCQKKSTLISKLLENNFYCYSDHYNISD